LYSGKFWQRESLGYYELTHKSWFDEGCSELLGQRKQGKLQWLQEPGERNGDNLDSVRHEASRHFKEGKEGISERMNCSTNSQNKNIRGNE
jgi:hypothetical protein